MQESVPVYKAKGLELSIVRRNLRTSNFDSVRYNDDTIGPVQHLDSILVSGLEFKGVGPKCRTHAGSQFVREGVQTPTHLYVLRAHRHVHITHCCFSIS